MIRRFCINFQNKEEFGEKLGDFVRNEDPELFPEKYYMTGFKDITVVDLYRKNGFVSETQDLIKKIFGDDAEISK